MIRCGNRKKHNGTTGLHATVAEVRRCHLDAKTWACDWQYEVRDQWGPVRDEDGQAIIRECGALAWELEGGRGFTCSNGHEHLSAETLDREGLVYDDKGALAHAGL